MSEGAPSEQLKVEPVRRTVALLHDRIEARFPARGLRQACADLLALVDEVGDVSLATQARVRTARIWSRALMWVILAATVVAVVLGIHDATVSDERLRTSLDWLPLVETVIADLVYPASRSSSSTRSPSGSAAAGRSRCCTSSGRWRTSSTCTS